MLDIDHFKAVNDTYGHDRGDAVLQAVAFELREALGESELVYRLGGEEFLVLLPGPDAANVPRPSPSACARRSPRHARRISTSPPRFGISVGAGDAEFGALFGEADAALYEAKRRGRNRVVAHIDAEHARAA